MRHVRLLETHWFQVTQVDETGGAANLDIRKRVG